MKLNFWSFILMVGLGLSSSLQIAILIGVYIKGGGTTGADPVTPILPFVTLVVVAVIASVWKRTVVGKFWYVSALISGLFGSALPFWLEFTGSLVQYERAIIHGASVITKDKLIFPLLIFGLTEIAVLVCCWYVSIKKINGLFVEESKSNTQIPD